MEVNKARNIAQQVIDKCLAKTKTEGVHPMVAMRTTRGVRVSYSYGHVENDDNHFKMPSYLFSKGFSRKDFDKLVQWLMGKEAN